jgi:hypothetical protein
MTDTVVWTGSNGTNYAYKVFHPSASWNDVPGNYIFAKRVQSGRWIALYIGETESLRARLTPSHEKWTNALRDGMTHIHAHTSNVLKSVRSGEELNLVQNYRPPCNN